MRDQCQEVEKDSNMGSTRQAFSLIKTLRQKFSPRLNVLQSQYGKMLQSKDEIKQRWTQCCGNMLRDERGGDRTVQDLEEITKSADDGDK